MRIALRLICAALPVLVGIALGQTTVAAMDIAPASDAFVPPPQQLDRYAMGQNWAGKHHPDDASACPAIDVMFQNGCIAATRY